MTASQGSEMRSLCPLGSKVRSQALRVFWGVSGTLMAVAEIAVGVMSIACQPGLWHPRRCHVPSSIGNHEASCGVAVPVMAFSCSAGSLPFTGCHCGNVTNTVQGDRTAGRRV